MARSASFTMGSSCSSSFNSVNARDHQQASTSGKSHHHSRRLSEALSSFLDAFRCHVSRSKIGEGELVKNRKQKRGFCADKKKKGIQESSACESPKKRPNRLNLKQIIQKQEEEEDGIEQQEQQQQLDRNPSQKKQDVVLQSQDFHDKISRNMKWIVKQLQVGSLDQQERAADQVRAFTKDNAENRVAVADLGVIPLLVNMLDHSERFQTCALLALLNLAIGNSTNKASIVTAGAVPKIVRILNCSSNDEEISSSEPSTSIAQESAAAALLSLSALDSNKPIIGQSGAVHPLVGILQHGTPQGKKDAIRVLYNLSICSSNTGILAIAGAVSVLLELLQVAEFAEKALATLGNVVAMSEQARRFLCGSIHKLLNALTLYTDSSSCSDSSSSSEDCSTSSSLAYSSSSSSSSSTMMMRSKKFGAAAAELEAESVSSSADCMVGSCFSPQRCQERLLYVLMVMTHHSWAARQAMVAAGAVSPLLEVALLGTAIAQRRAGRILECLREDRMQYTGRPVSAPMATMAMSIKTSKGPPLRLSSSSSSNEPPVRRSGEVVSEERKAVEWMVKQSLQRNMEKMVRRARLPSMDLERIKSFGSSSSCRSLPV